MMYLANNTCVIGQENNSDEFQCKDSFGTATGHNGIPPPKKKTY